MKRLSAAVVISAAALLAAGCSSSVDNPPSVGPTDPTMLAGVGAVLGWLGALISTGRHLRQIQPRA